MQKEKINYLAVALCVILQQATGALWYSEALFGTAWLKAINKSITEIDPDDPTPFILSFIGSITMTYILARLLRIFEIDSARKGAGSAALIWIGFILPVTATHYSFAGQPWSLLFIDAGHTLAGLLLTGIILAIWRK